MCIRDSDIYRKPASRFVAGFFGMPTMNFLEGEISVGDGAPVFSADNIRVPLGAELDRGLAGRRILLGVRSEHITVNAGDNAGRVQLIEPLGDDQADRPVVEPDHT